MQTANALVTTPSASMETERNVALTKLSELVKRGADRARKGMEALAAEYGLRRDLMVKAIAMEFDVASGDVRPVIQGRTYALTPHSRGQLLDRAEIPQRFAENLLGREQGELLRHNLRTLLPVVSGDGLLVRTVGDTAKGILSPSYRRMDASPLFEAYLAASLGAGLVPYAGEVTDTRAFLAMLRAEVVEIGAGEYVALGTELRASDYGRGALEFALMVVRLLCANGMIGMDLLRKVHIGRRFDAEAFGAGEVIELSTRTMELDSRTVRSALEDAVRSSERYTEGLVRTLRERVGERSLSLPGALASLTRKGLRKEVVEKVKTMYEQPLPVEAVPQEPGTWRFANVLSLLAHGVGGDARKDLEEAAFEVVVPGGRVAA